MSTKDENEQILNDLVCQQRGEVGTELENVCEKQENQQFTSLENQKSCLFS
jgi:hypothetical protein